jgi:Domain of unknown function (DUF1772)
MTIAAVVATVAAGLFAGACVYVTLVEHPARVECGPALAIKEFGRSYRRAALMQAPLAVVGLVTGVVAWAQGSGAAWLVGGLLLGTIVPFTLAVIGPTNRRLADASLDSSSSEAGALLARWGRLHAVRTVVGVGVFVTFAWSTLSAT